MSQTVDSKVVEMSFNNKNFEQNVQTSLNTIDKLKKSLNFSGVDLSKANVDVTPVANSFAEVGNAIDSVRVKFSALDVVGATVIANLTTTVMNFASRTLGFVTNAITQGGLNRAMKIQNARFQLNGLLHDAEAVEAVMADVDYGVADTAYGLDAAASVASQLVASGIKAGDDMKAYLRGISGVAAMTNSTYEEIGQIFTRVAGNGRLMAIDLQSLASRGMNAAATLGEAMGKTEEEIRDMVSKGKISFDDFAKAMDDAFGAHAKDANRTFSGVTANIRSALAKIGADFLTPFLEENNPFIQFLDSIRLKLNQFRKWLTPASDMVARGIVNMFGTLSEYMNSIDFQKILLEDNKDVLVNYLTELSNRFKEMDINIENLKTTLKGLVSIFDIFKTVVKTAFEVIINIVTSDAMGMIINGILKITSTIASIIISISEVIAKQNIISIFDTLLGAVNLFVSGVANALSGLENIFVGIKNFFSSLINSVGEAFSGLINWIRETISPAEVLVGIIGAGLAGVFLKLISLLVKLKWMVSKSGIFGILFGTGTSGYSIASTKTMDLAIKEVLGSLTTALTALVSTVRATTLVAIAVAVALLANALTKLANVNPVKLAKGLTAIVILMNALMTSFAGFTKTISAFANVKFISSAISLIFFAEAVNILANAVSKLGALSFSGLTKGLLGVWASMVLLVKAIDTIGSSKFSKVKIVNIVAILALAEACKIMADAFKDFADISWDGIARGLVGMGMALAEMVAVTSILSKLSKISSIIGSISILIITKTLDDISEALKSIGQMSWSEIERGLYGMGIALAELVATISILGRVASFSGILGGTALYISVQSLSYLSEALYSFGKMSWERILRGIYGMGVALAELVATISILGRVASFSGILGSTALLISARSLGELSEAFNVFGKMSWDNIKRGSAGMVIALGELMIAITLLGKIAPIAGILGGTSLLIAVKSLGDLAMAFRVFGSMSWDKITNGVAGLGAALAVLAVGGIVNSLGILGSISISIIADDLMLLADAFNKFGKLNISKIKNGFVAMLSVFGALAFGGIVNSLSLLGAISIEKFAKPLGDLADSVSKWSEVKMPKHLMADLSQLAAGVASFFGGFGVDAVKELAEPLGVFADSVNKWKDVRVPSTMQSDLKGLSRGVEAFIFAGLGTDAISEVAIPLGDLADSINKWQDVRVPEGLSSNLTDLAIAISAFTWDFLGSWSVSEIATPLGDLADSISRWKDIEVPTNIGDNLDTLGKALNRFGSHFITAWSMDNVVDPLAGIADAIAKWKDVEVPTNLGDELEIFARKVVDFAWSLRGIINNDYSKISGFAEALTTLNESVSSISPIDEDVITSFDVAVRRLSSLDLDADSFLTLADNISNAIDDLIGVITRGIDGQIDNVRLKGEAVVNALNDSFSDYGMIIDTLNRIFDEMYDTIDSYVKTFELIGKHLVEGLAIGISNNAWKAEEEAVKLAKSIEAKTKIALDEHSPSKVFEKIGEYIPKGLAIGISKFGYVVGDSVKDMSRDAISGTKSAIARLSDVVQNDIDANPTIRPILDLSNVYSGLSEMRSIFGNDQYMNFAYLSGMPMFAGKNVTYQLVLDGAIYNDVPEIENVVGNAFEIMGRYRGMNYG